MGFKSFVAAHTSRSVRQAVRDLTTELIHQQRHRRGQRLARRFRGQRDLRIQFGSGGNAKPGWINVDLFAKDADLQLDLRELLPFADDCAALVYAEHVMEHFTYPAEVRQLIGEVFRILQPRGVFSVVVPDAGRILQAYNERDLSFFAALGMRSYLATDPPTAMHHVNYSFRMDGHHRYAYDEETLAQVLSRQGFVDVHRREFDPALDSPKRLQLNSLYMQGTKPPRESPTVA